MDWKKPTTSAGLSVGKIATEHARIAFDKQGGRGLSRIQMPGAHLDRTPPLGGYLRFEDVHQHRHCGHLKGKGYYDTDNEKLPSLSTFWIKR